MNLIDSPRFAGALLLAALLRQGRPRGRAGGRQPRLVSASCWFASPHTRSSRDEGVPVAAGIKKPEFGPSRTGQGFSPQRPARPRPCRFTFHAARVARTMVEN